MLFSFSMTAQILFDKKLMDRKEFTFFLTGMVGSCDVPDLPCDWMDNLTWKLI